MILENRGSENGNVDRCHGDQPVFVVNEARIMATIREEERGRRRRRRRRMKGRVKRKKAL